MDFNLLAGKQEFRKTILRMGMQHLVIKCDKASVAINNCYGWLCRLKKNSDNLMSALFMCFGMIYFLFRYDKLYFIA
jgi:hypothetical protein